MASTSSSASLACPMEGEENVANLESQDVPEKNSEECQRILNSILACELDYCSPIDGYIVCNNFDLFKSHHLNCKRDCDAIRTIDHSRRCERHHCEDVTSCDAVRAKLSCSPDCCFHLIVKKLEIALLFESDAHDYDTFTTELMEFNENVVNDPATDSDSSADEFPPSRRRIEVVNLEALDYWTHVHNCIDNDCEYSSGSISCERKRNIIKLHRNYCTYQTCKNCMLIQKFLIRHTRTCNENDCPAPRCNDMRNRTKVLRSKSTGAARPKYEPPKI